MLSNASLYIGEPQAVPAVGHKKRLSVKPWGHDCREHRSWRCVWCESLFCFECDTGTTAFIRQFPYHRLCEKHLSELPGGIVSTVSSPKPDSGLSTPSTVDRLYYYNRHISVTNLSGETECSDKELCHCLIPKTMLCSECSADAKIWKSAQLKLFERSGIIGCAYGRYPGGCEADVSIKCGCGGRGIDCNIITDTDWEKFEATDFNWIGRTGLTETQFQKKGKRDLRKVFGENFPVRPTDSLDGKPRPFHVVDGSDTPPPSPKKHTWGLKFGLRRTQSISFLGNSRKGLPMICNAPCTGSSTSTDSQLQRVGTPKSFLSNPQMRKPYSNFRITPEKLKPPAPMRRTPAPFLELDSDTTDEENEDHDGSDSGPHSDHASIADSISTLGSEYDYQDALDAEHGIGKGLNPPPTVIHMGKAVLATRQFVPRLIQMRSSPNLKPEIANLTISKKNKERTKWGCRNEVDVSKIDLKTAQAHGFWRCSFCSGKINGI